MESAGAQSEAARVPATPEPKDQSKEGDVQRRPGITPYRAHAHKRYSSMKSVPEHDSLTFFVRHLMKCKPMHFE